MIRGDPEDRSSVSREEFEEITRRLGALERALETSRALERPCPKCMRMVPAGWFCSLCGAFMPPDLPAQAAVAPRPEPVAPPAPLVPAQPIPTPATQGILLPPSVASPIAPQAKAKRAMSTEALLGERFAPRVGALLVFLATLFFLGVAIQRGWIGPLAQLGLAAATGLVLIGIAEILAHRKGYGQYPQILEGLGGCVLYATAFVAHALPYYERVTRLTELGGGLLMAFVAVCIVALAVWHDARIIVGLGYALSFLTAGLGWGVLPQLTMPYVAILGASLALLVAWKGWRDVAVLGTLATGGFFALFSLNAARAPSDSALVVLYATLPAFAFFALTLRRVVDQRGAPDVFSGATIAGITIVWAVVASLASVWQDSNAIGLTLFAWSAATLGLAVLAHVLRREASTVATYAVSAVLLYLLAAPLAWSDASEAAFLTTATYAAGALALALASHGFKAARLHLWQAGLALAAAAALRALFLDARVMVSLDSGLDQVWGSWQAWATFAILAPAIALLFAFAPKTSGGLARVVFLVGLLFLGAWGFALFHPMLLTTLYLVLAGGVLVAFALTRPSTSIRADALGTGLLLVALGAAKAATLDVHAARPPMPIALAGFETLLVVGALLVLYHVGAARTLPNREATSMALLGGSAAVLASLVFAYAGGAWVSVLVGTIGVIYLSMGFVLREHATYRYTGFAALGFVLLRVFIVDLQETDLIIRALVFAILGGILLTIGYVYARAARKPEAPR